MLFICNVRKIISVIIFSFILFSCSKYDKIETIHSDSTSTTILQFHPWDESFNNCMKGKLGGRGPFSNLGWVLSGEVFLDTADCIGSASGWW